MRPRLLFISSFKRNKTASLFLFVGGLFFFACLFQYFFEKEIILGNESSAPYKVNRVLTAHNPDEIPIFGSSRAEQTFIPGVLGNNFYNYGLENTRDDVLLFFLEQECRKVKNHPYILLTFELEGYSHRTGDPNSYLLNINHAGVRKLINGNIKYHYNIPFIKYYGKYEWYLREYLNARMMLTKHKDKGASIEKTELTPEKFNHYVEQRKNTTSYFQNDSLLASKFNDLFRNHPGRTFIIIVPPYHHSYFHRFANYDAAVNFMSSLSRFPNVVLLNYGKFFFAENNYANTTHLNYRGALQFNTMLKDTLGKIMTSTLLAVSP